jgi:C1A family cysteine protease
LQKCYEDAKDRTITEYSLLVTLDEMLTCLADGYPFVLGLSIYSGFTSDEVKKTGVVNMPESNERSMGGHAVLCIGYNKKESRFLMKNSWGPFWGDGGYFTIPFEYVTNLGMDAWTIRR